MPRAEQLRSRLAAVARRRPLVDGALVLVGLYVVDDALVHRQPGVAASAHLLGVLLAVALLCASALVMRRARPGLRAAVALAWAPVALTAGVVDGVHETAVAGMRGDDLTAWAAAVAGVVLAAVGVRDLWTSRRRDGSRARRWARRTGRVALALAGAYLVVLPVCFAVVGAHRARAPVHAVDLGRPYRTVTMTTDDGLRLTGWYVPSRNRGAVIAFPGRRGPVGRARMLAAHGYGVLLLDRRGEGDSEGDFSARGWDGAGDLRAAIAFLRRQPDVDPQRLGGVGLSVGGELLLQAAAETHALRAVVSEGAGERSIAEQLDLPTVAPWRRWLSPMLAETAATAVISGHAPPPRLTRLMPRIAPAATLLISASDGNFDEALNRVYLDAARPPKALWELPAGGHTGAFAAMPGAYERRVVGFFDRHLLGQHSG